MQSKIATFASSIPLVVFNLVKVAKHQWIELFCFLINNINNKFIYFKQQQQQLQRRVWTTFTTKPQIPYGLAFLGYILYVREQFYHPNQEDTSPSYVHKQDILTWSKMLSVVNLDPQTKIGCIFSSVSYVSVEPGERRNVSKLICFFVWGNFTFHHFSNWTVCNKNAFTTQSNLP